jgi:hypothetical protein
VQLAIKLNIGYDNIAVEVYLEKIIYQINTAEQKSSKHLCQWYITTIIDFLYIIHQIAFRKLDSAFDG